MDELKEIDPALIVVNPFQPRRQFSEAELEELASSIKTLGILQPPLVRSLGKYGRYELIAGERRWRASLQAGLKTIPVLVRHSDATQSAEMALVENVQRVDLNPLEVAQALKQLLDHCGHTQEALAEKIGKKRSTVANYLRLLALPEQIKHSLWKGEISMGHAKAILSLESEEQQLQLHALVLRDRLNVRDTEELTRKMGNSNRTPAQANKTDIHAADLQRRLQEHLGTRVVLQTRKKGGTLTLSYTSLDDLDRLLKLLGFTVEA